MRTRSTNPARFAMLLLLLAGCARGEQDFKETGAYKGVQAAMAAQEAAWDRGDVRGFMAAYAEDACFITAKERTCGREEVTRRYLRSYPDQAAMGDLRFGIGEVLAVGADHAWCTGTWTLVRRADTLSGGFSLLWRKGPDGWLVLRDHTY